MLKLTIIRHAKSSWANAEIGDFERPLNERGRRDAPRMARLTAELLGKPDRIVSSPALRAISTARVFAETLEIDHGSLVIVAGIYEASLSRLLEVLRDFSDDDQHVMLFGHNPGLSELAHHLAACPFDDLPTCAFVQIGFTRERWREILSADGQLLEYRYPKQFRA